MREAQTSLHLNPTGARALAFMQGFMQLWNRDPDGRSEFPPPPPDGPTWTTCRPWYVIDDVTDR